MAAVASPKHATDAFRVEPASVGDLSAVEPNVEEEEPSEYSNMLKKLYARAPLASRKLANGQRPPPSLAMMYQLASLLENPQNKYPCVHIAGTNGKGSVATKLANTLLHGYNLKVGLLTSPHISCIRERIRVNNEMISSSDFIEGLDEIFACEHVLNSNQNKSNEDELIQANFFEIMTILGYHHFQKAQCDVAIIEVGIGGTWDCTNIIDSPLLSVMTSVSLDHTKILGKTVEAIATDKAGIIKPSRPVVIGPHVPLNIVANIAASKRAPLYRVFATYGKESDPCDATASQASDTSNASIDEIGGYYTRIDPACDNLDHIFKRAEELSKLRAFSNYNEENTAIACCAMEVIDAELKKLQKLQKLQKLNKNKPADAAESRQDVQARLDGLLQYLNVRPNCRLETYKLYLSLGAKAARKVQNSDDKDRALTITPVTAVLDVAHNPGGIKSLFESLNSIYPKREHSYRVVIGMSQDKDISKCMNEVVRHASHVHLVSTKTFYRSASVDCLRRKLLQSIDDMGIKRNVDDFVVTAAKGSVGNEVNYALKMCAIHNTKLLQDNWSGVDANDNDIEVSLLCNMAQNDGIEASAGDIETEVLASATSGNARVVGNIGDLANIEDVPEDGDNEEKSEMSGSESDLEHAGDTGDARKRLELMGNHDVRSDVSEVSDDERRYENKKEILVIMGSFYIMPEARGALGIEESVDDVHLDQESMDRFATMSAT